jgi:lysophospholipase L1-like esterase
VVAKLRYLALGDSYTIGTGVSDGDRWPSQLVRRLRAEGVDVAEPEYVAHDGWTTAELRAGIREAAPRGPYDLVSLLIGVNNQYRGLSPEEYRAEFHDLLALAIAFAGGGARRVIVLSIPDWSVTPFAEGRDRSRIALAIDAFNAVNRDEVDRANVTYVDITPESRMAATQTGLLAPDGLHPSGPMYARWAGLALTGALAALRTRTNPEP